MSDIAGDEPTVGEIVWETFRLVVGETRCVVALVSELIVDDAIAVGAVVVAAVDCNLDGTRKIALVSGDVDSGRFLFLLVVRCGKGVVVGADTGGGVLEVSMEVSVGADVDAPADGGVSVCADNGVGSVTSVGAGAPADGGASVGADPGVESVTSVSAVANVVVGSVEADVVARLGDEADCCSMLVKTRSCNRSLKSGRSLYFLWSLV